MRKSKKILEKFDSEVIERIREMTIMKNIQTIRTCSKKKVIMIMINDHRTMFIELSTAFKFQIGKIKKFSNAEYQLKLNYRTGRCQ